MTLERRAILAAVLMAALLVVYQAYFAPVPEPPKPPEATKPESQPKPAAEIPLLPTKPLVPVAEAAPLPRTATVDSPLYRAVVSSEGGKLLEWTLRYRGEKPMVAIGEFGPVGLVLSVDGQGAGRVLPMELDAESLQLNQGRPAGEIVLTGTLDGLHVRQVLQFRADTYTIDVGIRVENRAAAPRTVGIALPWRFHRHDKLPAERFRGQWPTEVVWANRDGRVDRIEDLTAVPARRVEGQWVAIGSTWYLAALIPKSPGFVLVMGSQATGQGQAGGHEVQVAAGTSPTVAPGEQWEGRVLVYVGPKEYDRLRAYGLEGTLNFGGFPVPRKWGGLPMEWLGVPILRLMNWTYRYVGNYGVAIILLTLLSRILFYPLTVKSVRSMKAMQALQPQINALRAKYRNDPRKLQEETLALYRKHRVNPMGGCLPMLAQIPIFYALYLALSVSVELQNAAFLCFGRFFGVDVWICDLASHDPTYVLPILMGVTMFVQQRMTPMAGDPRQQKVMLIMPFLFTFMFLNLPSGLVLYWTVSNLLQILQQWWMDRPRAQDAREAKGAAKA